MRYLMFTGNDDRTEVHRYSDDEVTEAARHLGRYGTRGQEAQLGRLTRTSAAEN